MSPHGSSSRTQLGLAEVHAKWTPSPKTHTGRLPKATRGCRETPTAVGELMAPHWPPALRPRTALMLWRKNKQVWGSTGEPRGSRSISPVLTFPLPRLVGCWGNPHCSVPAWPSSHPSSFPMPRQLLLEKASLGTAQNIPALFRLESFEVCPGSSPVAACPLQAVMQFSRSPGGLCEFISTPVTHTHTECAWHLKQPMLDLSLPLLPVTDISAGTLGGKLLMSFGPDPNPTEDKGKTCDCFGAGFGSVPLSLPREQCTNKAARTGALWACARGPISSEEKRSREVNLSLP